MLAHAPLPAPPAGRTGWPWTAEPPEPPPASADNWPRVTIVTPSFNQAEFLEEALRSVLLQGYPNLEYIVLDGGSTDGSVEIIQRYAPWLAYWRSGPDGGQSAALRDGFARATGEVLAWLNSDDVYLPGALRQGIAALQQQPETVMVYGDADEIRRDGARLRPAVQVRPADFHTLLTDNNAIAQPAAFFRRSAYTAVGGLDPALHWSMDYDLWLKLAARGPLAHLPHRLAQMRLYPEAKTGSGAPGMFVEISQLIQRHGGHTLPTQMAHWLETLHLPQAVEAYRQGDEQTGSHRLGFLAELIPAWRSPERLAELITGEAWRKLTAAQLTETATLAWAARACAALPAQFTPVPRVRGLTLGLLHKALAFQSAQQGHPGAGLRHAWLAVRSDAGLLRNRGLWAVTARAVRQLARPAASRGGSAR